jgi:hypothetical protein
MLKRIAQFFLWKHIRATLYISGIVLLLSILYRIGINLIVQRSSLDSSTGAFSVINTIVVISGILAFFVFLLSYMLYRRRKTDGSLDSRRLKK